MHMAKYTGYIAHIYDGKENDLPGLAAAKGEHFKQKFPGADYELVDGDPAGACSAVFGSDKKICGQLEDWINS